MSAAYKRVPSYCILFLFLATTARPQGDIRLNFRHIAPRSGLSSIFVRKIVQDPYGFMWVGTEDGLNRFDGKTFITYDKGATGKHDITGIDTRDLLPDSAHHLIWEINSYGGIDAIDYISGNIVYRYHQNDDRTTANLVFNSLAIQHDRLYIGSSEGLFTLDYKTMQLKKLPLVNPFRKKDAPLSIDNLLLDNSGHIWLFCRDQGVLLLKDSTLEVRDWSEKTTSGPDSAQNIQFYNTILLRDGAILSATSAGLKLFLTGKNGNLVVRNNPFPNVPFTHGKDVYCCKQDHTGDVWFCTGGHLVRMRPDGTSFRQVREHRGQDELNWLDAVYDICFDRDDNVWLGCQAGLAFSPNALSSFTVLTRSSVSDTRIKHAYTITPVNDSLLYCSAQDGLYLVHPAKGIIQSLDNQRAYYDAFNDPFGRLMVSNIDGTFIIEHDHWVPAARIYPEFSALGPFVISSLCYSGDSVLVFGTQNDLGVIIWNYKSHSTHLVSTHTSGMWLKEKRVTGVYCDHRGKVWVLGDKSIAILDLAKRSVRSVNTYDPNEKKFYSLFFDVCQVKSSYFVASYGGGVIMLDSNYRFTLCLTSWGPMTPQGRFGGGLSSNSVYKIIPYKDSLLFVTSNRGLSVIRLNNLTIRNYYESDGLNTNNFEANSAAIRNNIVYIGGMDGITAIDPSLFTSAPPPLAVYPQRISVEHTRGTLDTSNLQLTSLEIPSNARQTTVYFSSIYYSNPERLRFSYKLKDSKLPWIDLGDRNFIPIIGTDPGKMTIQVRATNEDGISSPQPLELTLIFLPKWYQTLWFKLLLIVAIAALLYSLYRYRIGQLHQQHQIRKDIAKDLHDDIGSTLNSVKIFTHLARREQEKEHYLSRIEDSLTQASMGLRDMIWVLDDSGDTIKELADRIRKFAVPVTQVNHIHFECVVEEDAADRSVSKTVKRNLLLIAKESINNSLKYADCQNIHISLGEKNDHLFLSISDDGKGFDTSAPASGHGLNNIRIRARQIGLSAQIESVPGKGTRITISET